jgi:hypothetical protein
MSRRYSNIDKIKITDSLVFNKNISYYKPNFYPNIEPTEEDIYIETDAGDRLDLLAEYFYGDINLYWIIAAANPNKLKFDSLYPKPGLQLIIPVDINKILSDYTDLNEQ